MTNVNRVKHLASNIGILYQTLLEVKESLLESQASEIIERVAKSQYKANNKALHTILSYNNIFFIEKKYSTPKNKIKCFESSILKEINNLQSEINSCYQA